MGPFSRAAVRWLVALVAVGVLVGLLALDRQTQTDSADSRPEPQPTDAMISDGQPAFASDGIARYGNDGDYATAWTTDGPGWLAYDLSSVPLERRRLVLLAWYVRPDDQAGLGSACRTPETEPVRPYLRDYTIEVNFAGPGDAPREGWDEVARVSDGTAFSGQHLVDLGGAGWIRIRGGGPNGIGINVDVADARGSGAESWLFLGDSITADFAGHDPVTGPNGVTTESFTDLIDTGTNRSSRPIAQNAGLDCDMGVWLPPRIGPLLAAFPGKFVTLAYGTNDAVKSTSRGWPTPDEFHDAMQNLVTQVRAAGKTPIVPTIPWPNDVPQRIAEVETFNAEIERLYRDDPDLMRGPDLFHLLSNREALYRPRLNLHLDESGRAVMRRAWADWALSNIYPEE